MGVKGIAMHTVMRLHRTCFLQVRISLVLISGNLLSRFTDADSTWTTPTFVLLLCVLKMGHVWKSCVGILPDSLPNVYMAAIFILGIMAYHTLETCPRNILCTVDMMTCQFPPCSSLETHYIEWCEGHLMEGHSSFSVFLLARYDFGINAILTFAMIEDSDRTQFMDNWNRHMAPPAIDKNHQG